MKDFSSVIKSKLNSLFGANFNEETTDSEVVDFIEAQEAKLSDKIAEIEAQVTDATTKADAKVDEVSATSAKEIGELAQAVQLLAASQKTALEQMTKMQDTLNKVTIGLKNVPKQITGDPAPEAGSVKEDNGQFVSKPIAGQVLENVRSIIPMS